MGRHGIEALRADVERSRQISERIPAAPVAIYALPAMGEKRNMPAKTWALSPDRCFNATSAQREMARQLYASVRDLLLVRPHGHVDPALLSDPNARFGSPAELFIIPGHYMFSRLYSQGVRMEELGVPTKDGGPVDMDHRRI